MRTSTGFKASTRPCARALDLCPTIVDGALCR